MPNGITGKKPTLRFAFLCIFLACVGMLGVALYLQEVKHLLPCPLCVAQRLAFWLVGLTALVAFLHAPQLIGRRIYSGLMIVFALIGSVIAVRHIWVIRHPEAGECGISPEEQFLNALPLAKWWPAMFEANGDCALMTWKFFTLTIPEWALIGFLVIAIPAAYVFFAKPSRD